MTSPSEILAKQAEHSANIQQQDKKIETLYTLHNGPVTKAMQQVERITAANDRLADSIEKLNDKIDTSSEKLNTKIDTVRENQLVCGAQRAQEAKTKESGMKRVAHYGAITVILGFVGATLLAMYKGLALLISKGVH
jgi:hypothetical protein